MDLPGSVADYGKRIVITTLILHALMVYFSPVISVNNMVWIIKTRNLRRPLALVSAACVSALVGVCVVDKIFSPANPVYHSKQYFASCANLSNNPSYQQLQKNQSTRLFEESVLKKLDVVFLGSNSPIEDRFVVGASENLGTAFFSLIDGHKGTRCSQYLQKNILQHISSHLHQESADKEDDLSVLMDMETSLKEEVPAIISGIGAKSCGIKPKKIQDILKKSFVSLDDEISERALTDVKRILSGQEPNSEMESRILTALHGACVLTTLVQKENIFVASTGDCRVVLGHYNGDGGDKKWKAIPLSVDQNVLNNGEVERVHAEHPGEDDTSIIAGRVLGGLMPFRSFGDVDYKWQKRYLKGIADVSYFYHTPPYVTAEPVLTQHKLKEGDKFLIIASDGLWDTMSNERAVEIVSETLSSESPVSESEPSLIRRLYHHKKENSPSCSEDNAATNLLWHALGGKEPRVSQLLHISPAISRSYRDDITIIVVYL